MGQPGPPRYVMLSELNGGDSLNLRPPPHRRNLPRYHSHSSSSSSSSSGCCCCLCWCCCFLLLFLILAAAAVVYFYYLLDPKPPSYSVDNLSISAFDVLPDLTLHTQLSVTVRAENPNANIGIMYGHGSRVVVSYRDSNLCSGHLPSFYQGHHNTTMITIVMEGQSAFGSGLQEALHENKNTGQIPLDVFVKVPVQLKLDSIDLKEVTVNVHCALVVDNLSPHKKVGIKSAVYKVNVEW